MSESNWWRTQSVDDLETAIIGAGITGIPTSWWVRDDELHVAFGQYGLRHVTLRPSKHDGVFLAELCGYAGA
jgi:hypothetical protein